MKSDQNKVTWKTLSPQNEEQENNRKKKASAVTKMLLFSILFIIIYSWKKSAFNSKPMYVLYFLVISFFVYSSIEPFLIKFTYYKLIIPNRAFKEFTAVHLSDVHIVSPYPYVTEKKLKKIVLDINNINPDFVFLTGDFITRARNYPGSCRNADSAVRALSLLRAKEGIFAVMGNNDACALDYLLDLFSKTNIRVLRQETVQVGTVQVCGIDSSKSLEHARSKLDELVLVDLPLKILLSHEPDVAAVSYEYGFDLQLSGHSHAGQFSFPFGIGPLYLPNMGRLFSNGLYSVKNRLLLFVSPGIGISTLPKPLIRFNCRPEVSVLKISPSVPDQRQPLIY